MELANRLMAAPPGGDEPGDVGFRVRIVARSPGRVGEALSDIDDEQGGFEAEVARLSPRRFGRAIRTETGATPAKAIERLRAEAAFLRDGSEPVEVIAREVGFDHPERMRRRS